MFDRRCRGYEAVGYTILLPASAVPGWPAEVPLPVDPQWKNDYAASVRRLVRDGARLAAGEVCSSTWRRRSPPDAEGVARARSASEAFLYRRLETLPETAGRFRLNAELPIPFDGWGHMEVDLLWADARVAIELDGAQHLATAWKPTVATGARTFSYRKTATSCCGSSPRTWASASMRCSTPSCEPCRIAARNDEDKPAQRRRLQLGRFWRQNSGWRRLGFDVGNHSRTFGHCGRDWDCCADGAGAFP